MSERFEPIHANGRREWFGTSGFWRDAESLPGPDAYARRLVAYIADDSTVRARVADRFGHAGLIPLHRIARLRANHNRMRRDAQQRNSLPEPVDSDRHHFSVNLATRPGPRPAIAVMPPAFIAPPQLDAAMRENDPADPAPILAAAAHACGIRPADLQELKRRGPVIRARALAAALLRARRNSWPWIARALGMKDHNSAMYLARIFFDREMADPVMAHAWTRLAPCILGAARTWQEFHAMTGGRK